MCKGTKNPAQCRVLGVGAALVAAFNEGSGDACDRYSYQGYANRRMAAKVAIGDGGDDGQSREDESKDLPSISALVIGGVDLIFQRETVCLLLLNERQNAISPTGNDPVKVLKGGRGRKRA